jgi:hypothetical protein
VIQSQPRQIVHETLPWKKPFTKKYGWSGSSCMSWVQAPVQQKNQSDTKSQRRMGTGKYNR